MPNAATSTRRSGVIDAPASSRRRARFGAADSTFFGARAARAFVFGVFTARDAVAMPGRRAVFFCFFSFFVAMIPSPI
jgi:hypothetical protein